ncbi:MAG: potassium channel family protein [Cyanobacteria bacterium P01_E01_bin.6]
MEFSLTSKQTLPQPHYQHLLTVMVLRLLIIPFLQGGLGEIVASLLFFYITFLIVQSYRLKRSLFVIFVAIAAVGFFLDIILTLGWVSTSVTPMILTFLSIYIVFFGSAALLILQNIVKTPRVTMDMVRGGICVYLLLGYFWALLYAMVYTLDGNAFSSALLTDDSYLNLLYFSFVTLTTLGFGDIVPVNEVASVFTILEALVGQMYPTVFIALLVGGYLANRQIPDE